MYSTSEGGQAMEHQESYLKVVFGFFGITDVRFVRAEGLAMGDAAKAAAIEAAARADIACGRQTQRSRASLTPVTPPTTKTPPATGRFSWRAICA